MLTKSLHKPMVAAMEKNVSRPKNEDIGEPLRDRYIKVMMTEEEKAVIQQAAKTQGIPPSSFLRQLGLRAAREG